MVSFLINRPMNVIIYPTNVKKFNTFIFNPIRLDIFMDLLFADLNEESGSSINVGLDDEELEDFIPTSQPRR